MGKTHETKHFTDPDTGEKIKESGKEITVKNTILVRTVRDAVFAILQGKDGVDIKQYLVKGKPVKLSHSPKKLPKKTREEYLEFPKDNPRERIGQNIKKRIHSALEVVGIHRENTDDKITTAMDTIAKQYKNMDPTRLLHRMDTTRSVGGENLSKLERDVRFVLGISHLFGKQGYKGMKSAVKSFFHPKRELTGLTNKSASFHALNQIIQSGKQKLTGKNLEEFEGIVYQAVRFYKKI